MNSGTEAQGSTAAGYNLPAVTDHVFARSSPSDYIQHLFGFNRS
jgi:hypothetical protein